MTLCQLFMWLDSCCSYYFILEVFLLFFTAESGRHVGLLCSPNLSFYLSFLSCFLFLATPRSCSRRVVLSWEDFFNAANTPALPEWPAASSGAAAVGKWLFCCIVWNWAAAACGPSSATQEPLSWAFLARLVSFHLGHIGSHTPKNYMVWIFWTRWEEKLLSCALKKTRT